MRPKIFILVSVSIALGVSTFASTIRVAVKRGQAIVDARLLPLACIAIVTDEVALPLDVMVLEDVTTHKVYRAVLSKTFGSSHPDLLTAVAGRHRSVSMAILHLNPGRYRVKSLEFVGPSSRIGITTFSFDLTQGRSFAFTVRPACANYVGSLVISADWDAIYAPRVNAFRGGFGETKFGAQLTIEPTAARDMKWASDVIPGMGRLRSESSPLEEKEP